MDASGLTRRQLLGAGGVVAGTLLLPGCEHDAAAASVTPSQRPPVRHVMSLIGEYGADGAYISSYVKGDLPIDLAVSSFPDMSDYTLVGAQAPASDHIVRHDVAGGLTPGSQYYARLVASGQMFGRKLSFRTQTPDTDPANLLIALVSCQGNAGAADPSQLGWRRLMSVAPDLLLHMGDYGYWGGHLQSHDSYRRHLAQYVDQTTKLSVMRDLIESTSSLIQVSDHETSSNDGDTYNDPITSRALEAYFRLMPFRLFDDRTKRSRFMTRKLSTNIRLISPDFRSLDRSPGIWPDDDLKTAYGEFQFELLRAALKAPEPLKIILSDPGCSPSTPPAHPAKPKGLIDKWCNYQNAYQRMADVIRFEQTVDGKPILVDMWSGDRHMLGFLSEENNEWGPFDVLTSSGIDHHALDLLPGEVYDQVFGNSPDKTKVVKQHMEIELSDDKAGNIKRVAHGIDNITGNEVIYDEKEWRYPVS